MGQFSLDRFHGTARSQADASRTLAKTRWIPLGHYYRCHAFLFAFARTDSSEAALHRIGILPLVSRKRV